MLGGASNPVAGSNPAGTGTTLNYVRSGKRSYAYAYSGLVDVNNNETVLAEFTTGSEIIEAIIQNFYAGVSSGSQPNPNVQFQTKFNSQVITSYVTFDSATDNAVKNAIHVVIPPYTKVSLVAINAETTAVIQLAATINGRVYA